MFTKQKINIYRHTLKMHVWLCYIGYDSFRCTNQRICSHSYHSIMLDSTYGIPDLITRIVRLSYRRRYIWGNETSNCSLFAWDKSVHSIRIWTGVKQYRQGRHDTGFIVLHVRFYHKKRRLGRYRSREHDWFT